MKRILVPCDFEESSREAFRFAANVAAVGGDEVLVLYVIDLPVVSESAFGVPQYAYSPELLGDLKKEANSNFEKLRKTYTGSAPISFASMQGPIRPTILKYIESQKIDLVIMGTHGASGWEELFIGSNTEKITRSATVPVIAIRKAIEYSEVRNIVLPSKLDLNQHDFIEKVIALQDFFHAKLHILFVNTPPKFKRDDEARAALQDFVTHYKLTNCTQNIRSDPYEEEGILNFAAEINADMIAMATHSRRGLSHLIMGSIAEDVLIHAKCPLWTYTLKKK